MDDFLSLAGISWLFTCNEFCSQEFILEFIVKNFFSINGTLLDIATQKLINFEGKFLSWLAMVSRSINADC